KSRGLGNQVSTAKWLQGTKQFTLAVHTSHLACRQDEAERPLAIGKQIGTFGRTHLTQLLGHSLPGRMPSGAAIGCERIDGNRHSDLLATALVHLLHVGLSTGNAFD